MDTRSSNADLGAGARRNDKNSGKRHHAKGGAGGRGKREYDRHDASGRGHETEKRHGGGKGNWGAEGEEIKDFNDKLAIEDDSAEAAAEEEAEEEKQMSLEEYEALMAEKKAALNAAKEAAFKVDESQFAGMKTFEKVEDDIDLSLNKHAKVVGANKAGREKDRKEISQILDVGFRIQSEEERRGPSGRGRGGNRGGSRGGRREGGRREGGRREGGRREGGRGGRGGRSINVEDTQAFPSLG